MLQLEMCESLVMAKNEGQIPPVVCKEGFHVRLNSAKQPETPRNCLKFRYKYCDKKCRKLRPGPSSTAVN